MLLEWYLIFNDLCKIFPDLVAWIYQAICVFVSVLCLQAALVLWIMDKLFPELPRN